jgi:hypothetical protein
MGWDAAYAQGVRKCLAHGFGYGENAGCAAPFIMQQ